MLVDANARTGEDDALFSPWRIVGIQPRSIAQIERRVSKGREPGEVDECSESLDRYSPLFLLITLDKLWSVEQIVLGEVLN